MIKFEKFKKKLPNEVLELEKIKKSNDLEKLQGRIEKIFELQKILRCNDGLDKEAVYSFTEKGASLWDQVISKVNTKYEERKAVIIKSVGAENNLRKVEIYDGVRRRKKTCFLSTDGAYDLLVNAYVWFSNQFNEENINKTKTSIVATGEGAVLMDRAGAFIHGLKGFSDSKEIKFISGPIMFCKNANEVNEFVSEMVTNKSVTAKLTLYRNNLLSLTELFAGYFHFYVTGDSLFVETPHEFLNSPQDEAHRIIINDPEMADEFRCFAESYVNTFASSMQVTDEVREKAINGDWQDIASFYHYTSDVRKEKIDKDEMVAHLEKQQAGQYA